VGAGNFQCSVQQGLLCTVADTLHSVSTRVGACRTLLTDLTTSLAATTTVSRIHRVHVGAGNFQFSVQQGLSSAAVNFFKIWEYVAPWCSPLHALVLTRARLPLCGSERPRSSYMPNARERTRRKKILPYVTMKKNETPNE
jgi:hypothetical protein